MDEYKLSKKIEQGAVDAVDMQEYETPDGYSFKRASLRELMAARREIRAEERSQGGTVLERTMSVRPRR